MYGLRDLARQAIVYADAARRTGMLTALRPTAVARYAFRTVGRRPNPSGIITLHALNAPEKEALVSGERRFTYRQLDERIDRAARAFAMLEARPGSRVAVMLHNCPEYLECQWAATRLGAIVVQIGYRLKAPEVAFILGNSEPAVLVVGPGQEAVAREALALTPKLRVRLVVTGAEYEDLLGRVDPGAALPSRGRDDSGGLMIYTSGTTGRPKGAARDFKKNLHESVADLLRKLGVSHEDRHLCVAPLYHSAAPAFVAFTIGVGGTIILMEHFEAAEAIALMRRERVSSTMMVPTMLARLVAALDGPAPTGLRWIASGAAPLPTETARQVEAAFGPVLYNFYGATETGLVSLALPGEHTAHPGTIGRALSGNEVRLLDDEGREVPAGAVGELYVRNSMLIGYHRDQAATQKAMKDGFFSVGDMARVDADGFLYLADRKHDMVISGGVNIYPLEIEQRLHEHPAVADVAVIGVPDAEWGESLKAFVVFRPGQAATADELRDFCRATLANFKAPKHFAFVDTLPRNPTGKVLKRELRGT